MISGAICCIIVAFAPRTIRLSVPFGPLALRELDRFGRRYVGIAGADDLSPAADDGALDETEAAERRASGIRQQLGNRARAAAAWPFEGGSGLGSGDGALAHGVTHAIAMPCPPSSLPISLAACSPGTTRMRGICRGGAGPAQPRPIPFGSGCRRSCSSKRPWRRWGRGSSNSSRAGRMWPRWRRPKMPN